MKPRRLDYDAISHLYDSQPHRTKAVDAELLALMRQRTGGARLSILDIACGTGNQLVANRSVVPFDRLVGLDRSQGMLWQARAKAPSITWIGLTLQRSRSLMEVLISSAASSHFIT